MTPESIVRQLNDQGIDPRQFALDLLDFVVWLDAGDHNLDQLAEHYRLTPAQALRAVMRRESLAAQVTA